VDNNLTIQITSFSYKKGLPTDESGNGGGFIFDCRFLPNPGRLDEFKALSGMDKEVIEFFQQYPEVNWFVNHAIDMLRPVIDNYKEREFTSLSVSFGCTGGQHRSVYCANALFFKLKEQSDAIVKLSHRELNLHSK
jgi:RNase adaptor protein for sRNA GlmZ degradation